jgi:hypothetical protein
MFGADNHAGGFESHFDPMRAECAFGGGVGFGVKIDRVVGTGLQTGFAADANGRVKLNDAIIALIDCGDGADAHARRVGAVIAACDLKVTAHGGVRAYFNIFDPGAIHTKRHLVLGLARSGAGVTSDAFTLVDEKSVVCHRKG